MLLVVFISFIASIFVAVQDPIIQKFAIRIAGGYISEKTGAEVRIGRLYISPNFTIHIEHFTVKDLKKNDLLNVEELRVRPIMEDIIQGKIHVGYVELNDAQANLITYEGEEHMNFQFLLDAFASNDEEERFNPTSPSASSGSTGIHVDRVLLKNLDFQFWNQNSDQPELTDQHLIDYSHLSLDSINLDMERLTLLGDTITARLNHLTANEISGFKLVGMTADVKASPVGIMLDSLQLRTENSDLNLDLHLAFEGFQALSSFIDSVNIDAKIHPSDFMISDFGPVSSTLYEMPDLIHFEGKMHGTVGNFKIDGLKLNFGKRTRFVGDIALQPLDLDNRVQVLNIKKLDYDCEDLGNFYLPISTGTIPMPTALTALDHGTISGQFNGSLNKFKTTLKITSEIGNVSATLDKRLNERREDVFEGDVTAERLNAGLIAGTDVVGVLDLTTHVTARLTPSGDLDLDLDGSVLDAELLGTIIDEIELDGKLHQQCFNGKIHIDDNDLGLDFNGRFDFSDPKALGGDFQAEIGHADLYRLHLLTDDKVALLQASINANVSRVNSFNEAEGTLTVNNVTFTNSSGEYTMNQFKASIVNDSKFLKQINANCDFFDFKMMGMMDFTTLVTAFQQYVYHYVELPQWTADLNQFENSGKSSQQDFIFDLNIKKPKPLTKLLMPSLTIAKNTTLNGTFTTKSNSLNLTFRSNYVKFNGIRIDDIVCRTTSFPQRSVTRLTLSQVILRDSTENDPNQISLDQLSTIISLHNDSINVTFGWDDFGTNDHNKARIKTSFVPTATGGRFSITSADILLNDSTWTVSPNNYVEFDDGRVRISNVALLSHHQSLSIDGYVPTTSDDTLAVALNQFDISTFDFVIKSSGLDPDGLITGNASVSNLSESPTVIANLDIKDLGINGQACGDAVIFSRWNNEESAVDLNLGLVNRGKTVINLNGSYYTEKEENLDFKLTCDSLDIGIVSPFLEGTVSRLGGACSGIVDIKGSASQPDIKGMLRITRGGCLVDYLNTYYTFAPTITLSEGLIDLGKFSLTDTLGNEAQVSGSITHHYLNDFNLNILILPKNFLAMATNADLNSSFYGTAVANGLVKVSGPIDNLDFNIKAFTCKGTSVTLPLSGSSSVRRHEFITFVEHKAAPVEDEEEEIVSTTQKKSSNDLNIKLELVVNNDAQVKIAMPDNLGLMEARGSGTIKVDLPATGDMTLVGDYVISSGSLALNIQDLLKRNFALEPGSRISWSGDPINGIIDAAGVYQTKASLSSLGLVDSTSMSSSNVRVDCLVHLKNKLLNPDITFGLRLPKAPEDMQQAVFNIIDTTNQSEVLVQAVYLMLFNTFNYGGTSGSYTGYTGFISNQLNDLISQLTNDIDINVNYRPGSEMSNEEMTVAMRKQLFDDRLTIETNFGVVIPNSTYASNSTNIVGDFNIDYKITKDGRFSGQVFNRSNYNSTYYQYTYYKMAPYTQGIGFSYSKSFDNFRDLFKRRTNTLNLPNQPAIARPTGPSNQQKKDEEPKQ